MRLLMVRDRPVFNNKPVVLYIANFVEDNSSYHVCTRFYLTQLFKTDQSVLERMPSHAHMHKF
jgi:hypothetical protein